MPEGFCKCGALLVEGKCPECKPKVLVIYFNNGLKKQIRNISENDIDSFIKFVGGMAKYRVWDYKTTNVKKEDETVFIPYQSVSYFELRECVE